MSGPEPRVRGAFRSQGESCALLGSPFMGRLMPLIGERLTAETAVGARVLSWDGDVGPAGQSVPLRLAGALHGIVLDGADDGLRAVYPPVATEDDALWAAVATALARHAGRIMAWLDHAPQTNEVRRSSALIPALWWLCDRIGTAPDLILSELGASAGLNLGFPSFAIETQDRIIGPPLAPVRLRPEWRGAPVTAAPWRKVIDAAGVDRNPIDARDPKQALRLLSYLWPDQPQRLTLTRAAIGTVRGPPDRGDAAPWLAARLGHWLALPPPPPSLHVVYNTVAWQYFPPETQAACTRALEEAGARATPHHALAHVALEADGRRDGAALTVRLWPHAPHPRVLARADFHGRWVDWQG